MREDDEHPIVRAAREDHEQAVMRQRLRSREVEDAARRVRYTASTLEEAREATAARTPVRLTADHMTLLQAANWEHDDGAVTMDPKRPYGNSNVEYDLERLLPHLSESDRECVHRELPLVIGAALTAGAAAFAP